MFKDALRGTLVLSAMSLLLPAFASAKTTNLTSQDKAAIMKQVRLSARKINRPNMLPSGSKITPDSRKHLEPANRTTATFSLVAGKKPICEGTCDLLKQGGRVVARNASISWKLLWPVPYIAKK